MKINIWLNDFYVNYESQPTISQNMSLKHVKRLIKSGNHTYILRGEPGLHPHIFEILEALQGKDFILSTHGYNKDVLVQYRKNIPYIVLKWDGIYNDFLKGGIVALTSNIESIMSHFSTTETTMRIEYVISNKNINWLGYEAPLLRQWYGMYERMKRPYFVIFQQSEIFKKPDYTYVSVGPGLIQTLNNHSLLTQKTLNYLTANLDKRGYSCLALSNEMTFAPDGTARLCQSHLYSEILGSIETTDLEDIISYSETRRKEAESCPLRSKCWMAYHYKDNVDKSSQIFDVPK